MVTTASILTALEGVHDPHAPISIRRMGMLGTIEAKNDGTIVVKLRMPCLSCPGVGMLREQIRQAILDVPEVTSVHVEDEWERPWAPEDVDPDVRKLLREKGLVV